MKLSAGDSIFNARLSDGNFRPGPADKLYRLAEACRNSGRLDRMAGLLRTYLRLAPGRPETAIALALTGRYEEALQSIAAFLSGRALSPHEIFLLGNPWLNIQDPAFIKKALKKAAAAKAGRETAGIKALHLFILRSRAGKPPGKPPLFRGRLSIMNTHCAQALLEAGRPREAAGLLAETENNFPLDEYCCGKLAEALLCSGREKEALALMAHKAPLLRTPGFSAWRGQLLLLCGKYALAAAELKKKPAAASPMSLCWLGAALLKLGKPAAAEGLLKRAVKETPSDLEAAAWLAETLRISKKPAAALKAAQRVLALAPAHPWALLNGALLNGENGSGTEARRLFRRFSAGPGSLMGPPRDFSAGWALSALERAGGCRRPEPYFISLAAGKIPKR